MDYTWLFIYGIIALIGLWVILSKKAQKMIPYKPIGAILFGAVLIGVGAIGIPGYGTGLMTNLQGTGTTATTTTTTGTTITTATFDIVPTGLAGYAFVNGDNTGFTCPARSNQTATPDDLYTVANSTTYNDPDLIFTITPNAFAGASAIDMATIHYEVTNPDVTVYDGANDNLLFTRTGADATIAFSRAGVVTFEDGSFSMLFTANPATLYCNFTVNEVSFAGMTNTYTPVTVYIRFYNDAGWEQIFPVDFVIEAIW